MPWQVERNPELGFIDVVYSGVVTNKDAQDTTAKALCLATGDGPHLFLSDLTDARSELSVSDIFELPKLWSAAGASRRNRLAVVVPEGAARPEDSRLYENVANNRGWNVRVFGTRQAAIEWFAES